MPFVTTESKLAVALPDGFSLELKHPYVRVARVETVSLISRDLTVQFVDGSREDEEWVEPPVKVTAIIGSMEPGTTYTPSALVYGKGDLCAVMILENQDMYAISVMDLYHDINRENYATIKGWGLYDVLGGINIDGADDGANSYLIFWHPGTHVVTRINGDVDKNKTMERLVYYFVRSSTTNINIATVDDIGWSWDTLRSGPENNVEQIIDGRVHRGRFVNGLPYVEDRMYGEADLSATLTAYHPTQDLAAESVHPDAGDVVDRFFEHTTIVWFPGDTDPTHVLVIGTFPSWTGAQYIMFLEVPVYSLAGRKFLEREIIDEGLPTEERNITHSWQRFADQVRILKMIPRDYIGWSAHASDITFSERLHKNIAVYHPRLTDSSFTFGILDGYGYAQGGTVFDLNQVTRITGSVTRNNLAANESSYTNGSRYTYEITSTNPIAAGYVDIFVNVKFEYEYNGGNPWEQQTVNIPTTEYPSYTDGTNTMHRTVDLNYYCDGYYDETEFSGGGMAFWSDGTSGGVANVQDITNTCTHDTFRNNTLRWTDSWAFYKTIADGMWGSSVLHILFYSDVEYDLYVLEKIETTVDQGSCTGGPGQSCTGTQVHTGLVKFQGVDYVIWTYTITLITMPTIGNYWPWISDTGKPGRPASVPYSVDTDYDCGFWYEPHFDIYLGTLRPGYSTVGFGYPGPLFSAESMPQNDVIDTSNFAKPTDLIRVSVNKAEDSFAVRFECYMVNATNKVLEYPNYDEQNPEQYPGHTVYRFNSGTPHFNKPVTYSIINL